MEVDIWEIIWLIGSISTESLKTWTPSSSLLLHFLGEARVLMKKDRVPVTETTFPAAGKQFLIAFVVWKQHWVVATKTSNIRYLIFYRKNLPTHALKLRIWFHKFWINPFFCNCQVSSLKKMISINLYYIWMHQKIRFNTILYIITRIRKRKKGWGVRLKIIQIYFLKNSEVNCGKILAPVKYWWWGMWKSVISVFLWYV